MIGILYTISIPYLINLTLINIIEYNNITVIINKILKNSLEIILPNTYVINNNNILKLIYNVGIDNINRDIKNNKYYFKFTNIINYIINETYINIDNNIFLLKYNLEYYIEYSNELYFNNIDTIKIFNIILLNKSNINNNLLYVYECSLANSFIYTNIDLLDIIIITSDSNINPKKFIATKNNIIIHTDIRLSNLQQIIYTQKIYQNYNKITDIINEDQYLYYLNIILSKLSNSKLYIHNKSINRNININNIIDNIITDNKLIQTFYQKNNLSYFITNYKISIETDNIIQVNEWSIIDFSINNTTLIISLPNDFILISTINYFYKINDIYIDYNKFIIQNNYLIISDWQFLLVTKITLFQIYIIYSNQLPILYKPIYNILKTINFENTYEYDELNIYIAPLLSLDQISNFYNYSYLYLIEKISIDTINNNKIIVYVYENIYFGIIFKKTLDTIIIALNIIINTNKITFEIDSILYTNFDIKLYQNIHQICDYYKQINSKSIQVFVTENNYYSNSYNFPLYLISSISYTINSNNNISNLTKLTINDYSQINTNISLPIWPNYSKFFNYIRLYFNDQLIEELNENTYNIDYYLYSTDETRKQIDNLTKIRLNNNSWEFILPLSFWFSKKSELALPLIALQHTQIKLNLKLNNLSYILSNNLFDLVNQNISIYLLSEYILLETHERDYFNSNIHEYIINKFTSYQSYYINSSSYVINNNLFGLIKDIYLISKPINYPNLTYIPNIIKKYDFKYEQYLTCLNYYNNFIINGYYTTNDEKTNAIDIDIIKNINIEYNNYIISNNKSLFNRIEKLIKNFSCFSFWNIELLKYLMYYQDKYLPNTKNKIYPLLQYLLNIYKNEEIIHEISPISSLQITINNSNLFNELDHTYFTNTIPVTKFFNTLPIGYYAYTFSLYPLDNQPSGHLNFTHIEKSIINIKSTTNEPYLINILVKEYSIIKIISGIGSLTWIN